MYIYDAYINDTCIYDDAIIYYLWCIYDAYIYVIYMMYMYDVCMYVSKVHVSMMPYDAAYKPETL